MSFTPVTSGHAHAGAGNPVEVTLSIQAGDLIVAATSCGDNTATITVSDGTNTYTKLTKFTYTPDDYRAGQVHYVLASAVGGSVIFACTCSPDAQRELFVWVFRPSATPVIDQSNGSGNASSTSVTSGNVTTTGTDELSVGWQENESVAAPSSMQINGVAAEDTLVCGNNFSMWYVRESATYTGAATCTIASAGRSLGLIATFKITAPQNPINLAFQDDINADVIRQMGG